MKKLLYQTIFCFFCIATSVYASHTKFYLGLDASLQSLDIETQKIITVDQNQKPTGETKSFDTYYRTKTINPAIFLGLDIAKLLKIEASYSIGSNRKKDKHPSYYYMVPGTVLLTDNNIQHQTASLDFKPYMQLKSIDEKLFAFLIVGVSYNKVTINEKEESIFSIYQAKQNIYKTAPVVGIGAEYLVLPNLALRTQLKYTYFDKKTDDKDPESFRLTKINNITNLNFGVAYYF